MKYRLNFRFAVPILAIAALIAGAVSAVQAEFKGGTGGRALAVVGASAQEMGSNLDPYPSPTPSQTPDPSASPEASTKIEIKGIITAIDGSTWTIDGVVVIVNEMTRIEGDPTVGDYVEVEAYLMADGSYIANEIETESMDDMDDAEETEEVEDDGEDDHHDPAMTPMPGSPSDDEDDDHEGDHHQDYGDHSDGEDDDHEGDDHQDYGRRQDGGYQNRRGGQDDHHED